MGVAELAFATHQQAEEAMALLRSPSRLYNQNYRIFVGRDLQVMWAAPFEDLAALLAQETRVVLIGNIGLNTSLRRVEEELGCFGQIERLRRFATHVFVTMRSVAEAKALLSCGELLVDGRRWNVRPAFRQDEDPQQLDLYRHAKHQTPRASSASFNSNEPAYELSVLQLTVADRQRLYEVIQSGPAFPCKKDALVKGLSHDLLNKGRRLLQHSRRPAEPSADYLLPRDNSQDRQRFTQDAYTPTPYRAERPPVAPVQDLQNLTLEQRMQYFYMLNSKQAYNPYQQYKPS
jgi:hypothetical protein